MSVTTKNEAIRKKGVKGDVQPFKAAGLKSIFSKKAENLKRKSQVNDRADKKNKISVVMMV